MIDSLEENDTEYVALIPIYDNSDDFLNDSGELVIMQIIEEDGEQILDIVVDDDEYFRISEIFMSRLSDDFDFEVEEPEE